MTMNRWKILACTLTIGVGGLAVFATPPLAGKPDAPKEPAPLPNLTVKPASAPNGDDTPAPAKPAKTDDFDLVIPVPDVPAPPARAEEPAKKPSSEPVFEPVTPGPAPLILPAGATETKDSPKPDEKTPAADKAPPVVTPPIPSVDSEPTKPAETPKPATESPKIPLPDLDLPPIAGGKDPVPVAPPKPETPKPGTPVPTIDLGPAPPSKPAPPTTPIPDLPPMAVAPAPSTVTPISPPVATSPAKPAESTRLKMLLRMGDGQPRFEIRNSTTTELLLKVYAEKIEMQTPPEAKSSLAGVSALGRVRFTAPGIEGTCDHLTILSGTGEVLLKGNIRMKTRHGKSWSEMTAEKMVYQIGASGLSGTSPSSPPVRPASYIPD
jgi:hypothetical protein